MLDFLLIYSKSSQAAQESTYCAEKAKKTRPFPADLSAYYQKSSCRLWIWGENSLLDAKIDDYVINNSNGIKLYTGLAVNKNGDAIPNISSFINEPKNGIIGDYLYLEVENNGNVKINQPKINTYPIYYYEDEDLIAVGSTPLIVSSCLKNIQVSENFARTVLTYSVCFNNTSIIESVKKLMPNETLEIQKGILKINKMSMNFLQDQNLELIYKTNRKEYWDLCFESLRKYAGVLNLFKGNISFPLSGGKDSRLLLSLIMSSKAKDKITDVFTNGPAFSPEVLSAQNVAEYFGLQHRFVDNTTAANNDLFTGIYEKLYKHFYLTNGELSPMDLCFNTRVQKRVQLHGQESGLRNIAGKKIFSSQEELYKWFSNHLAHGDILKSLFDKHISSNQSEISKFIDQCIADGVPINQIPTLHRIMFRGSRWVSTLGKFFNTIQFAPFLFFNECVVKFTYNAGSLSRSYEEFHYEMLKRVDVKLTRIPFAQQTWPKELEAITGDNIPATIPYEWPENFEFKNRRGINSLLADRKGELIHYLDSQPSVITQNIIDLKKLKALCSNELMSGHYQPLWQLIQLLIAERILNQDKDCSYRDKYVVANILGTS